MQRALQQITRDHFRSHAGTLTLFRSIAAASDKLQLIKQLRERSGSPISDVKAALEEAEFSLDEAYQVLRKKGLAAASKKASRHAAEGLIGLAHEGSSAALIEINSETDFVAGNDQFRNLVLSTARLAAQQGSGQSLDANGSQNLDCEELLRQPSSNQQSLEADIADAAGAIRENIRLRRAYRLSAPNGIVASYLHISPAAGLGRIGTLVALENKDGNLPEASRSEVQELGTKLAMHAAASSPIALDGDSVSPQVLEEEEAIVREQLAASKKPPNIIEKIVAGKMNRFYQERCFLDQNFIMDEKNSVRDELELLSKRLKVPIQLTGFVRLQVGEGLENEAKKDFAAEVQDTLRQTA